MTWLFAWYQPLHVHPHPTQKALRALIEQGAAYLDLVNWWIGRSRRLLRQTYVDESTKLGGVSESANRLVCDELLHSKVTTQHACINSIGPILLSLLFRRLARHVRDGGVVPLLSTKQTLNITCT